MKSSTPNQNITLKRFSCQKINHVKVKLLHFLRILEV